METKRTGKLLHAVDKIRRLSSDGGTPDAALLEQARAARDAGTGAQPTLLAALSDEFDQILVDAAAAPKAVRATPAD